MSRFGDTICACRHQRCIPHTGYQTGIPKDWPWVHQTGHDKTLDDQLRRDETLGDQLRRYLTHEDRPWLDSWRSVVTWLGSWWSTVTSLDSWRSALTWLVKISCDLTWPQMINCDFTWLMKISCDFTWLGKFNGNLTWLWNGGNVGIFLHDSHSECRTAPLQCYIDIILQSPSRVMHRHKRAEWFGQPTPKNYHEGDFTILVRFTSLTKSTMYSSMDRSPCQRRIISTAAGSMLISRSVMRQCKEEQRSDPNASSRMFNKKM